MNGKGFPALSAVLVVTLVMYPVVGAGSALGAEKVAQKVIVKVGELKGTLLDTMGKPAAKVPVKVLAKGEKPVAAAVTAKDGTFAIKTLAVGDYTLKVGDKVPVAMTVAKKATLSHLLIIVPSKATYSAGQLSGTTLTWVIVGGVLVATAITLPLALSDGDDDDEAPASTPLKKRRPRRLSP